MPSLPGLSGARHRPWRLAFWEGHDVVSRSTSTVRIWRRFTLWGLVLRGCEFAFDIVEPLALGVERAAGEVVEEA